MKKLLFLLLIITSNTYNSAAKHVKLSSIQASTGRLTVICGPMYAGKSEELIRIIRRATYAGKNILVIKHAFDDRTSTTDVASHNGTMTTAHAIKHTNDITALVNQKTYDILCIDEIQFYSDDIITLIMTLVANGVEVIVSGLDQDFRGLPFGPMPTLLALADEVIKLSAICMQCGAPAPLSQRLIDGQPAKFDDPIVLIGAQESYQARCRNCFVIDTTKYIQTNEE